MKRIAGCILAAAALAACGFPSVPRGASAKIDKQRNGNFQAATPETPPIYGLGAEQQEIEAPEGLGRPHEIHGRLVGNAVSSLVIQTQPTGWVTLQVTPQTMLRIGNAEAGLREIQPGSEVRAMSVPTAGGDLELAIEVVAEPGTVGWPSRRGPQERLQQEQQQQPPPQQP